MEPNQPQETPVAQTPVSPKKSSWGGILAIIVILILIVVGAFYAWGERIVKDDDLSPEEEQILEDLENQDSSTDPAAIEADLQAQSAEDFDKDFDAAFNELDASFDAQ